MQLHSIFHRVCGAANPTASHHFQRKEHSMDTDLYRDSLREVIVGLEVEISHLHCDPKACQEGIPG